MTQFSKILIFILFYFLSSGVIRSAIRYHCPEDSTRVLKLIENAKTGDSYGEKVVAAAKSLKGISLAPAADNDSTGTIVIRLDSLNRREFINVALAAAKTAELTAPTLRDFERNLESISRKKGTDEGFASQFLYGADWIVDNVYRGNLKEMTDYFDGGSYRTKTLDFVSRHPELFPAMKDPETADKIRVAEFGYRSHRIPHLKKHYANDKKLKELIQNGDIIIMNAPDADFDIYDIGIVSIENGEPTLIHIPHSENVVTLDPYPIPRLFKIEGQYFYGFRWLRPLE